MIYRKYEFQDEQEARELLPDCIQVHIGVTMLNEPEIDEEGEIITAPVFSNKWAVDCLLTPNQADNLTAFEVWPANPKHHISGWEEQYEIDRNDHLSH
jgi:hypothetical protein